MKRLHRRTAIGGAVLVAVLTSSCGPSLPGAAATVGDERITVDALRELTERSLRNPEAAQRFGEDRPAFVRRELAVLIRRELLGQLAAELDVEVSRGEVDEQLRRFSEQAGGREELERQAAASGVATVDLHDAVRDLLLEQAVGDALVADLPVDPATLDAAYRQQIDQFDQVHAAHILVGTKALADRILADVRRNPAAFATLAARHSTDTSNKDRGGDLGFNGRGQFVKPFSDAIFRARPGTMIAVRTEFGFHVVHVIERRTRTLAEATPELRRQILGEKAQEELTTALRKAADDYDVRVSPRYGRFDAASGEVLPRENDIARPEGEKDGPRPSPTDAPAPGGP